MGKCGNDGIAISHKAKAKSEEEREERKD